MMILGCVSNYISQEPLELLRAIHTFNNSFLDREVVLCFTRLSPKTIKTTSNAGKTHELLKSLQNKLCRSCKNIKFFAEKMKDFHWASSGHT